MTISVDERKAAMTRVLVRLTAMFWDEPRVGDVGQVGVQFNPTTPGQKNGGHC
jgi:hypothetical protein